METCGCGGRLFVQKTRRKTVLCMTGPFLAHETVFQCLDCSATFASDALLRLAPSRCNVAYDVLVFVGRALFQRYRTTQEVKDELLARNVRLSISEIDYLGRKFVTFLANGHHQAAPRIRQTMKFNGGYILHLDAAHDCDAPALMTGMDGLSKIVLANVKLPSENADYIVPFLENLQTQYGTPGACVHDMGAGILKAVGQVFPGIPDFICHFHFLRDIGRDFLEHGYQKLRQRLRYHATTSRLHELVREARRRLSEQSCGATLLAIAIKNAAAPEDTELMPIASAYSLALWCLHGKRAGDGYGFPFDRPLLEFVERLLTLNRIMPELLDKFSLGGRKETQILQSLAREVSCIGQDVHMLGEAVKELRWRCMIFDRLRKAMRIAAPDGAKGLNDEGEPELFLSIRQNVEQFRHELGSDPKLAADSLSQKMVKQIDKYKAKLFADPIEVSTPNGRLTIYPNRTNNILEQFFRKMRRGHRRKTGNDSMRRTLQTMLADTPLVKNLENQSYMEMLLNGKANLEELFADLGRAPLESLGEMQADTDRILSGYQALMKIESLPEQVLYTISKPSDLLNSN